jgi:hypothetical protein
VGVEKFPTTENGNPFYVIVAARIWKGSNANFGEPMRIFSVLKR